MLHARYKATGNSAHVTLSSRETNEVDTASVELWMNSHGPPVSSDVEFVTETFKCMLRNYGILFEESCGRRHNKIGISGSSLSRSANIVPSHHFFSVKYDGAQGKLKLKCRIAPHSNRDDPKDEIRSDSSTTQFPIIRTVLSMAALHKLKIATLDIFKACPQARYLQRYIYMRPLAGFKSRPGELWKILKPAHGLVESGRLWQTTIGPYMIDTYRLDQVCSNCSNIEVNKDHKGSK